VNYYRIRFTAWRDSPAQPYAPDHKKVGSLGYMMIENGEARGIVDDSGNAPAEGAQFCYEIIDTAPLAPWFSIFGQAIAAGAAREERELRRLAKTDPLTALLKKENLL
jgi:hypothetical protein